ncbi:MAG: 3-deoxy-D-manno-octulosonic acid transferase [Candidatus Anoxychlamydiales bacterium]|nr:3-deoxy-D-manno-octulosonic acid transferase [Candidatus Anoxychlamydiales bacterium]
MIYNFLLFLYFLYSLPKVIYEYLFFKKKKSDFLKRLGFKKYQFNPKPESLIIWIHAVSVGETKAAKSLLQKLKSQYKNSYIIISSITETGHIEAKRSLSIADKFIFFPFDFSFSVNRVFSQIKPDLLIFMETDFWPNFIRIAKKNRAKIVAVSAKISERSYHRYLKLSKFSKSLFQNFDLILTQTDLFSKKFVKFAKKEKVFNIGNLKLSNIPKTYPKKILDDYRAKLNIQNQHIITIASTHENEEELLITKLKDIPNTKILIAPRHPERFNIVYKQLQKITPCSLFSRLNSSNKNSNIILIDKMGILDALYQISSLAILGGSFINRVGGHNILEPIFSNTPVFFGPYMHSQLELKKLALDNLAAKSLTLENITSEITEYLKDNFYQNQLRLNCTKLKNSYKNILDNTFDKIYNLLESNC